MNQRFLRILIPLVVLTFSAGIMAVIVLWPNKPPAPPTQGGADATDAPDVADAPDAAQPDADGAVIDADADADAVAGEGELVVPLTGLRAFAPNTPSEVGEVQSLGSLNPEEALMLLELNPRGAGISRIVLSDQWQTARARRKAEKHYEALAEGKPVDEAPLPPLEDRYLLEDENAVPRNDPATGLPTTVTIPILGTHSIRVNGQVVNLLGDSIWSVIDTGDSTSRTFETFVRNDAGEDVLHITRIMMLAGHDITLLQRIANLTGRPLEVQWIQYGPGDLIPDRARYLDRRRFRFGYRPDPVQHPEVILADDNYLVEREDVAKRWERMRKGEVDDDERDETVTLWPMEDVDETGELVWFASTNRYFTLAVHPLVVGGDPRTVSLEPLIETVQFMSYGRERIDELITFTYSPLHTIPAREALSLNVGIYAGPLDRHVLGEEEPYAGLRMGGLIIYQMSSFCAICTFQWLAHILLWFLSFIHAILFDWGVAIIVLVLVVRTLLHPITKKGQISMRRSMLAVQAVKPEADKLDAKYRDDPRKLQQEKLRLYREHGVNPAGSVAGCLPMVLQMPIWVALYAMLYFAFDLRQEPAFYGIFQAVSGGAWSFLADLSTGDHCFGELETPKQFFLWNITGFNLLPLLMGAIFFVQQKYMAPPPSTTMSKEMQQQQKMLKIIMPIMFPLMLYSAPSGLTLYILTSSLIGIFESRYVRKHMDELDLQPTPGGKKKVSAKVKKRDPQARAYAAALERAREKAREKQLAKRNYKKRK